MRKALLSSTCPYALRLSKMTARDYAAVLAMAYRGLGLTHLEHLKSR